MLSFIEKKRPNSIYLFSHTSTHAFTSTIFHLHFHFHRTILILNNTCISRECISSTKPILPLRFSIYTKHLGPQQPNIALAHLSSHPVGALGCPLVDTKDRAIHNRGEDFSPNNFFFPFQFYLLKSLYFSHFVLVKK